ncbi:ROK family protein [Lederbergia wuyishanensis]|uniref:NBD/HSP70 family sugar kinase n=1 Tax=Lederbergia wuyishanensis TaxID=1347903 RepID=A0ABU0D9M3_9BACI|nr:ROK family protein [Lederbergia wuyishanensis]MCJ8007448.1 ROK family protein [Lederbergia wuyishanensis]MDQ0345113.1 putative NBD/HSP70 family sugar kinase [Lederbergia wuyishanensis]
MKSYLPNDIKDENRKIIFDILLQHPELAKVEITEKTAISFVTVSKIVNFFESVGILKATGESREGSGGLGRKRTVYRFVENSYVTIGIQIIGNKITAVLVNLHSQVINSYSLETEIPFYREDFTMVFEKVINQMKAKASKTNSIVLGIGIGVDGAINTRKKTIRMKTKEYKEQDFLYEDIMGNLKSNLPIILENDVNASTVAEFRNLENHGSSLTDLVHITLGDGIGAGIIINKKLHRGINSSAGELEYMCFDPDYRKNPSSVGWLESKIGIKNLFEKEDIQTRVDYISKNLALTITSIISILDIHEIIIGGKTIDLFPDAILKSTKKYVEQYTEWTPNISLSHLEHSAALGAAILILQQEIQKVISGS